MHRRADLRFDHRHLPGRRYGWRGCRRWSWGGSVGGGTGGSIGGGTGGSVGGGTGGSVGGGTGGSVGGGTGGSAGGGTGGSVDAGVPCNGACGGGTPVCHPTKNVCVACLDDSLCSGLVPYCDLTTNFCSRCTSTKGCSGSAPVCDTAVAGGLCVGCLTSPQCGSSAPVCDTSTKTCVTCTATAGCSGATPVCDVGVPGGQCVGCTQPSHCSGLLPVCDTAAKKCATCTATSGCTGTTPVCDTSKPTGLCVGCLNAGQCGGSTPVCDTSTSTCATCTATAGCAGATPVCRTAVAGGQCVQCTQTSQCSGATPVCNTSTFTCATCLANNTGCTGTTPACNAAASGGLGQCVACNASTPCTTGVCKTATSTCVTCLTNAQCSGVTAACDTSTNSCVACVDGTTCGGTTPICDTSIKKCVGCLNSTQCGGATPVCDTTNKVCVGCLVNATCANPAPICGSTKTCRACSAGSSECGVGNYCNAGSCRVVPNTCALAEAVTLPAVGNTLTFTADTRLATDNLTGTCNVSAQGAELVYKLTLAQAKDVLVTAARNGAGTANPVLYVRDSACLTELACKDTAAQAAATESVTVLNRVGDLFLVIETYGASSGLVDVTVTVGPPTLPPTNDECSAPQVLVFDGGVALGSGNTLLATNSNGPTAASPTCSFTAASTGRDVVFRYGLTTQSDVDVTVTPTVPFGGTTATLQPAIYLRKAADCANDDAGVELACLRNSDNLPHRLSFRAQDAGSYSLWVDSFSDTSGPFDVAVVATPTAPPPANDTCAAPQVLTFVSNVATAAGTTRPAFNSNAAVDPSPSCSAGAASSGRDLVYQFTTSVPKDVVVQVTPTGTSTLSPVVYVRPLGQCASPLLADQLTCDAASGVAPVVSTLVALPAGTYALWVDGQTDPGHGAFALQVALQPATPAPANDLCAGSIPLTFDVAGFAIADGTTFVASNNQTGADTSPTCSTFGRTTGHDVVYSYNLGAVSNVVAGVAPRARGASTFRPVLYEQSACPGVELACFVSTGSGQLAGYSTANHAAGTFTVYVDSATASDGDFRLMLRKGAPANESCATPRTILLSTPVLDNSLMDSTALAVHDYGKLTVPGYSAACSTFNADGRDVVYAFTAPTTGTVTVTVEPQSGFDVALYWVEGLACTPANCTRMDDSGAGGTTEVIPTIPVTAGTTYWIIVDGFGTTDEGAFRLSVSSP